MHRELTGGHPRVQQIAARPVDRLIALADPITEFFNGSIAPLGLPQ